jgi:hypothetical protein
MCSTSKPPPFCWRRPDSRRRKAADDNAAARELAEELGRLALVLEQAAATIDKLRCGFRRYLEIWRGNRDKVVGWARPAITGYHHAVAATWQTSVDQLTEDGLRLLERLAFLAPDPVPMSLLDMALPDAEAEDHHAALEDLAAVSLVTWEIEDDRFSVHRLVQDVTRRSLDSAASRGGWPRRSVGSTPLSKATLRTCRPGPGSIRSPRMRRT